MSKEREITSAGVTPVPDWHSTTYWDAARDGVLLIKHCEECERNHWYPRAHCPHCMADETVWLESAGRGTIATFTVIRQNTSRAFREWGVYVLGMVELDEGARVFSMIRGPIEDVAVGERVTVGFQQVGDAIAPVFDLDRATKS